MSEQTKKQPNVDEQAENVDKKSTEQKDTSKAKPSTKTVPEAQYEEAVSQITKAFEFAKKQSDRADEMTSTAQRLQADFDNYRKRNADAVLAARKNGQCDIITEFFPSLDVFESALTMITDENVKQGVRMVQRKLMDTLVTYGVEPLPTLGCDFDPEFHEAIDRVDTGDAKDSDKVVAVLQQGYRMGDKILRHSLVRVGK